MNWRRIASPRPRLERAGAALVLTAAAALAGCGLTPNMQSARIHALASPAAQGQLSCPVSFGVRDLRLAGYLDRAEIITSRSGSSIQTSSLDVWASPLREDLKRIIARSVAQRWDGSRLLPHPWRFGEVPAVAIDLLIEQFEPQNGLLEVSVYWQILRQQAAQAVVASGAGQAAASGSAGPALAAGMFRRQMQMQGNDAAATVAAMNNALSALADDLARQGVGESRLAQLCRTN